MKELEIEPYVRLLRGMVRQAIKDYHSKNRGVRDKAKDWIFKEEGLCFEGWLENYGGEEYVRIGYIRRKIRSLKFYGKIHDLDYGNYNSLLNQREERRKERIRFENK